MLYKNISKRTIRVINVILKPGDQAEFPEGATHVKTFLRLNWLAPVAKEVPVAATPVVVEEVPVVVETVVEEAPVVVEEAPAQEVAPEVSDDSESKRGKGKKGKWQ